MVEMLEMNDPKKVSSNLISKLKSENITEKQFMETYGQELKDGEFQCMLDGIYFYNDRMNRAATNFLGFKVNCKSALDIKFSFRNGKGNVNRDQFIKNINVKFNDLAEKTKHNFKSHKKFCSFKEFIEEFEIKNPVSIEQFIKDNQLKDNFLVVKSKNDSGISGMSAIINRGDIQYKCIYINSAEPMGRQVFTFFHELYHIYFEESEMHILKKDEYSDKGKIIESQAHKFASEVIINSVDLIRVLRDNNMSNHKNIQYKEVYYIQKRFNATFQLVIFKIEQLEKELTKQIKDECTLKQVTQNIPKIPNSFKKYYNKEYWETLNSKIKEEDPDNEINFPTNEDIEYI